MKRPTILLTSFAFLIFFSGCFLFQKTDISKYVTPIPPSTKTLDIPKYPSGHPFTFWHFCKQKEKQLSLVSPEKSQDSLRYRLWITNVGSPNASINQPHGLIEINYDSSKWTGKLTLMRVNFAKNIITETITSHKIWDLTPKTNWKFIIDSLFKLKMDLLPTDEKIPNYYIETDRYSNNSTTFSFEYSTKTNYRFYQYGNVYRVPDKFWQPKNVISILNLLDNEIKWDSIAHSHFK